MQDTKLDVDGALGAFLNFAFGPFLLTFRSRAPFGEGNFQPIIYMSIHKKTLFRQLNKRKKADILALLELAFDNMPESMRSLVFDAAYQDILLELVYPDGRQYRTCFCT